MPVPKKPATEVTSVAAALLAGEELPRLLKLFADYIEGVVEDRIEARDRRKEIEAQRASEPEVESEETPDFSREREKDVQERPLGPVSLCGSWFHRLVNEEIRMQGSVVAEIQAGIYLCELHNWRNADIAHQQVFTLEDFVKSRDAGEEWRFYDSLERMQMANAREPETEVVDRELV